MPLYRHRTLKHITAELLGATTMGLKVKEYDKRGRSKWEREGKNAYYSYKEWEAQFERIM